MLNLFFRLSRAFIIEFAKIIHIVHNWTSNSDYSSNADALESSTQQYRPNTLISSHRSNANTFELSRQNHQPNNLISNHESNAEKPSLSIKKEFVCGSGSLDNENNKITENFPKVCVSTMNLKVVNFNKI